MALREPHTEEARYALLSEFALCLSEASDMEALTKEVVPKLKYLIDFNRCTLALLAEDGTTYRLLTLLETRQGMSRATSDNISSECGISGKVMLSGEMYVLDSSGRNVLRQWPIADEAMEGGSLNSIMCLPLQVGGKPFGAITFGADQQVGYTRADVSTASIIAMHLSLAIDRWNMIQELRTANEEVQKLNTELEKRVQERTAELAKTNMQLSKEVDIRQRAETALRESEVKYRAIFTEARDGIVLANSKGQIVECNPEYERQTGRELAQLEQMKIWQLHPSSKVEKSKRIFRDIVKKTVGQSDIEFEKPGGDLVHIDLRAKSIEIDNKKYILGIVRDISEQKRTEERYRSLYTKTPIMLHSIDATGKLVSVSDYWLENLGYELGEVIGHAVIEFLTETSQQSVKRIFLPEFFKTGLLKEVELQFVKKNSEVIDVLLSAIAERDAQGKFIRSMAVLIDVTERKRAQQRLAQLRRRSDLILNSAGEGIYGIDRHGHTAFVNPAGARMLGWLPEELHGKPQHAVIHHTKPDGKPYPREECPIYAAFKDGRVHRVDNEVFWRKDGTSFPVEYTSTPIRDEQDRLEGAVVTFRDITKRKQAEKALQKAHDELEIRVQERTAELSQTNELLGSKNEELESFAYSVSHDLRAPLRSIDGFSQALLEDYSNKLDDCGRGYLNRVRAASQRMGHLIDDLLHLSRVSQREMIHKEVDLSIMAETITKELREKQPQRQVTFVIAPEVKVNGDVHLLRIVLENLLGNAWKYTGKHSRAKIEFGVAEHDGKEAYFVRDDGAGFDSRYAGKLFGPFQRLHKSNEFEGNGIGLATVQRIIHRHGGRVWTEGAVEKGATFFFTLPQVKE